MTNKRKSSEDSSIAPKRARAAPVSLVNLSDEEIAERKKQQNRAAALRYRQKLRENRVLSVSAKETLSQRNAYLRDEAERLTKECEVIRRLIFDKLGKNAPAF
uniref:BZIP domain-containing protein n=1 Tax=Caenorhabditis tropicalis TaxID=1561998 RepID=A0A1I7TSC8_9PELO